jgi:pimeloyl-ACP methyl ester carboxylesterase
MLRYALFTAILCSCSKQHDTAAVDINFETDADDSSDDSGEPDGAIEVDEDADADDGQAGDDDDIGGIADDDEDDDDDDDDDDDAMLPNLAESGTFEVTSSTGRFTSSDGCDMAYQRYATTDPAHLGEVYILHGFMRAKEQFFALAEHLASWGITATAVDLCHSTFIDVDTEQNSRDAVELARSLSPGNVVWMGQSNGGLSALIAGGIAPDITAGVLGLDPVESMAGGGDTWAAQVTSPAAALFGISDSCNSENSGRPIYAGVSDTRSSRINEADHCSFEFPSDFLCTAVCERAKSTFTDTEIRSTIMELSTAWALGRLESDFDDSPWWNPSGDRYGELTTSGAVSPL